MEKQESIIYIVDGNSIKTIVTKQPSKKEEITFSSFVEKWLAQIKMITLKPASYDRIETTYRTHLKPELSDVPINSITNDMIQSQIITKMFDENLSYSTIKKAFDFLNECLEYAKKKKLITDNPMDLVVMPRRDLFDKKEIRILSEEEIEKFKEVCNLKYSNGKPIFRYGYVFLIMLYTGVRVGEMCSVEWKDIDFEKRFFYLLRKCYYRKR